VERPPGLAGSTAGSMFGQIPVRLITGFPLPPSPPTTLSELEGKDDDVYLKMGFKIQIIIINQ